MAAIPSDACRRFKVVIDKENYYLTVGQNFVDATVPRENSRDNEKLRIIVDTLCSAITKALGGEIAED